MDRTLGYAEILKQTVQDAVMHQPRLQNIKLYPVCDSELGHFLVLATGWDKQSRMDAVLFHARLVGQQVLIEEDNFEESLTETLITNGIATEHIVLPVGLCE